MYRCCTTCSSSSSISGFRYIRTCRVVTCIGVLLLALAALSSACPHHGSTAPMELRQQQQQQWQPQQQQQQQQQVGATADGVNWMDFEDYSAKGISKSSRVLLAETSTSSTTAAAAAALNISSQAQDPQLQQQQQPSMDRPGPRCGVRNITALEQSSITFKLQKARLSAARLANPAPKPGTMSIASVQQQQQRSLTIDVYFHVVSGKTADSTVNASPELLAQQLAVMNSAYGRYSIRFALKGVTRVQSDTWAVTEINSDSETAMKNRLRRGGPSDLNIYFIRPSSGTLGWSTFPWEVSKLGQAFDGVVVHVGTLPGGTMAPYNKGFTLVHEVGHWLGLLHVFENGCGSTGDSVDDTPPQASAAYGCPLERETCPGSGRDPVTNYMGYTDDACMTGFTRGQADRILDLWTVYRGVLDETIVTESGTAQIAFPVGPIQQPVVQPQQQEQQLPAVVPSPSPPAPTGLAKLLPALFRRNTGQQGNDATAAAAAAASSSNTATVTEDSTALYATGISQDPAALFAQQQAAVAAATGQPATNTQTYMQQQQQQQQYYQQQQQQQQGNMQGYSSPFPNSMAHSTVGFMHNAPSFTTTYRPYNAAVEATLPPVYGVSNPAAVAAAQQALQGAAWPAGQQQQQQALSNTMQFNTHSSSNAGAYSLPVQIPAPEWSMPAYIQAKPARSSSSDSNLGSSNDFQATLLAAVGSPPPQQQIRLPFLGGSSSSVVNLSGRKLGSISANSVLAAAAASAAELLEPFPAVFAADFSAKISSNV